MTDNKNKKDRHLFYLNELSDYKVASDDPDVRGWDVRDKDDRVIGKVDNLLVNKQTEKVVYLDVEVDKSIIEKNHEPYGKSAKSDVHEFINKDGENHLIIPIGHARLNEDKNFVYTDKINHQTFAETKRKEKGAAVDREYEVVVLESYNRDTSNARTGVAGESATSTNNDLDTGRDEREMARNTGTSERENRQNVNSDLGTGNNDKTRVVNKGEVGERKSSQDDDSFYDREDFDKKDYRHKR